MKRIGISFVLLFTAISIAYAGQDSQDKNISRYYVGIGVNLAKFEDGNFQITRVLRGGTADYAGLKAGDFVTEIEGLSTKSFSLEKPDPRKSEEFLLTDWFKDREGRAVNFKIYRKINDEIYEHFNVDVYCVQIDRLAWIPLDLDLGGSFCTGQDGKDEGCITYTSKVSEDKSTGKFIYRYEITNKMSEPVILNSVIFNLLFRRDASDTTQYQLKLDPVKTTTIVLESEDLPVEGAPSSTRIFQSADANPDLLKYFKEEYPDTNSRDHYYKDSENRLWLRSSGVRFYFFVPASWYQTMQEDDERFWKR